MLPRDKWDWLILTSSTVICTLSAPFAGGAFPSAEEYLEQEGVNPGVVDEIAPNKNIHIVTGIPNTLINAARLGRSMPVPSFMGTISVPSVPFIAVGLLTDALNPPNGNAWSAGGLNLSDACLITLDDWKSTNALLEHASLSGDIPKKEIRHDIPVTAKEIAATVALHEIRHCNQGDIISATEREADADYYAITTAAREFRNPEIISWIFNWRAARMPSGEEHDMALYLDARLQGAPAPSGEEIKQANKDAGRYLEENKSDISSLSPLARRRVELYRTAQEYFRKAPAAPQTNAPAMNVS